MTRKLLTIAIALILPLYLKAQPQYVTTIGGDGNGFRLWGDIDNFKIHMGNSAEYHYGPVTEFAIKSNQDAVAGRGWVWGGNGATPVGALSIDGSMKIAGSFTTARISVGTQYNSKLITLFDSPTDWYGFGIQSYQMRLQVPSNARFSFFGGDNLEAVTIKGSGNVGIGTAAPDQKLTVNGTLHGKEVIVDLSIPGPDYVFEKTYALPSLDSVKIYIDQNKHLPDVPPACEMEQNGIKLGDMNMLLLKKVEELTLYMIELKNENKELKKRVEQLEK